MFFLEQDPVSNRNYLVELFIAYSFLALVAYTALSMAAPMLIQSDNAILRGAGAITYIANIWMCHEMPERSSFFGGAPMALCERCMAIFVAAIIAYIAAFKRNMPKFLLSWQFVAFCLIPIAIDGFTQLFGLRESNTIERFATGALASFGVVYFLIATLLDRFEIKNFIRKGVLIPTLIPFAFFAASFLLISMLVGSNYVSANDALQFAETNSPSASAYLAEFIPPHATLSIPSDPFLSSYNDPILRDVGYNRLAFRGHDNGVWIAIALNSSVEKTGKFAYFSHASGNYYYLDGLTKEQILNATH